MDDVALRTLEALREKDDSGAHPTRPGAVDPRVGRVRRPDVEEQGLFRSPTEERGAGRPEHELVGPLVLDPADSRNRFDLGQHHEIRAERALPELGILSWVATFRIEAEEFWSQEVVEDDRVLG